MALAVGLMSGTSADGIDACLVRVTEPGVHGDDVSLEVLGFLTRPYPADVREGLLSLSVQGTVQEVCVYNFLLGRMFAEAAEEVVRGCGVEMGEVEVIGSHGHTICHLPEGRGLHGRLVSSTLQIGEPSLIANECGVTTVADFRLADMAVGGQGAPLVPYLDRILLRQHLRRTGRPGLALNLGGIGNVSACILTADRNRHGDVPVFLGFDCGPGNMLVDALMRKLFGREMDEDGKTAFAGRVCESLVNALLQEDRFIHQRPPKSTGREHYGEAYLEDFTAKSNTLGLSPQDCIATVTSFTAAAVLSNYRAFIKPHMMMLHHREGEGEGEEEGEEGGVDLFVSGGGARNPFMMREMERRFAAERVSVSTTRELGVDPDAKEAVCFALLAHQTSRGLSTNMPEVTGAQRNVILGKICPVKKLSATTPN